MALTMKKIARLAGTSQATVSDVLRNRWQEKRISEATCKRILEIAAKANYRPNQIARSLVRKKTQVIGVQVPSFLYEYCSLLIRSLDDAARALGYHILLAAPAAWQNEAQELLRLYEHQVDGLVINPQLPSTMGAALEQLRANKVPMVFLGNPQHDDDYLVTDDDIQQATLAVDHLIGLGHRRIAHLAGPAGHQDAEGRWQAYLQTMHRHGLPSLPGYVERGDFEVEMGCVGMKRLLQLPERPTAVYCANDPMAIGAIKAIEEAGRRVPEDIAIVGHGDDVPFSWFTRIPLTTIAQPAREMAQAAMRMIVDLVEGRPVEARQIRLPGKLVVRTSCGRGAERGA